MNENEQTATPTEEEPGPEERQQKRGQSGATKKARKSRIRKGLLIFLGILLVWNLGASAIFNSETPPPTRFSGPNIYDPYGGVESQKWKKTALHLHTDHGFPRIERHTPREVFEAYGEEGYDIRILTDYHKITDLSLEQGFNIPAYEWGMNVNKRHFLVVGAPKVRMDAFPLFALDGNIQHVIDEFRSNRVFLVVNHPAMRKAFTPEELAKHHNYNAIEVLTRNGDHPEYLDAPLTAGRPVFAMAADDCHFLPDDLSVVQKYQTDLKFFLRNIQFRPTGQPFRRYILLKTESMDAVSIWESLCKGRYVAVRKEEQFQEDPGMGDVGLRGNNQVFFSFKGERGTIRFIGEGGKELKKVENAAFAQYTMQPDDPYVRVEAETESSLIMSNPFFRYEDDPGLPECGPAKADP